MRGVSVCDGCDRSVDEGEELSLIARGADIEALDVGDVEPTSHPIPMVNVLRPDELRPALDRDLLLSQAPAAEAGQFRVPPILGEEP